ncbi:MAG: PQQ-dependent sugar dehydrogenase [Bacteroidetes bacterium]|nr:PQQ-dependent sugar dehydrogenase [Bacteroidota bacterium]
MKLLKFSRLLYLMAIGFVLIANGVQSQQANFTNLAVSSGWSDLEGFTWDSTGQQYVWEKAGKVWVVDTNGVKIALPLINISSEVGGWRDHGLNGFALDPNFRVNGYIYLYYTVDRHHLLNFGTGSYNAATNTYFQATIARVTRYTCDPATNFTTIFPGSRLVLVGEDKKTGIPVLHESHSGGSLIFGTDGSLFISTGDGASYNFIDSGGGATYWSQALLDTIIVPKENVGSFRSQMVDCLNGKILRIDPATGDGLETNPFFDSSNPRAPKSRVWALGLRNPFRVILRPGTGLTDITAGQPGTLYIGDVGWDTYEDLSVNDKPGQNFGWPLYEGLTPLTGYQNTNTTNKDAPNPLFGAGGCTQQFFKFNQLLIQATLNTTSLFTNPCDIAQEIPNSIPKFIHDRPIIDYKHGANKTRTGIYNGANAAEIDISDPLSPVQGSMFGGSAALAGVWYSDNRFPVEWQNTYFHADYVGQWIRNIVVDSLNVPSVSRGFWDNNGVIVYMAVNPRNGCIAYVNYPSQIKQICYGGIVNNLPTASLSADVYFGAGPLTVNFTGNQSTDPENLPLAYSWNFGDGNTSSLENPVHIYNPGTGQPVSYYASLTVTDDIGQISKDSMLISVNNTPPQLQITSFNDGDLYSMNGFTNLPLTANVTDLEHPSGQLFYEWRTILHHNAHTHIEEIDTNKISITTISPVGCEVNNVYYFEIALTVTDAAGLSTSVSANIYPSCSPPNTAFSVSDSTICKSTTVQFNDLSTNFPIQWEWEFQGGTPATSSNSTPLVTYNNAGVFDVKLITSSIQGSDTLLLTDFIRVYTLPNVNITSSTGQTSFCAGSPFSLIANSTSNLVSYNWTRSNIATGTGQPSLPLTKGGNYRVKVTDDHGCTKETIKYVVVKNPLPDVTLTTSGPLVFCPGDSVVLAVNPQPGNTYQWKKYANNIAGATNSSFTAVATGTYKVIVTSSNNCIRSSVTKSVSAICPEFMTDLSKQMGVNDIKIFPNPTNDHAVLDFINATPGLVSLDLTDVTGRVLKIIDKEWFEEGSFEISINTSDLPEGMYQVKLYDNLTIRTQKLVVVKASK